MQSEILETDEDPKDLIVREDFGEPCFSALIELIDRYSRYEFTYGRNRIVFLASSYVVKIPMNSMGCQDNEWEGSISNLPNSDPLKDIQYARTRLINYKDIPIVLMERVQEVLLNVISERLGGVPDWVYSVDCGQVGFTKQGKLKAFDYGW